MSKFILQNDNTILENKVFLCDRMLNKVNEIYPVYDLKINENFNSNAEISFKIFKLNNQQEMALWEKITDLSIVFVENHGYFEIAASVSEDNALSKSITGQSLAEVELSQTYITIAFNTEEEIVENENYQQTVFYDSANPDRSMLDLIFRNMPHYSIKHVDKCLCNIQRTFSCDNSTVYDFLNEIAKELECIFIFDRFSRTVSVYTLVDRCLDCQSTDIDEGVCQECVSTNIQKAYGEDTGVFIDDTKILAESLTLTGARDEVKNCFRIEGGDDLITNRLGNRLMDGNYIWKFSNFQTAKMSEDLQKAIIEHQALVDEYQQEYNYLWDAYNANIEKITYYQSTLMPSIDTTSKDARAIYLDIMSQMKYTCKMNYTPTSQIEKNVLRYAKMFLTSGYTLELKDVLFNTDTTYMSFKLWIHTEDYTVSTSEGAIIYNDEYTSATISLPIYDATETTTEVDNVEYFTTNYFRYLKQQLEIGMAKVDADETKVTFQPRPMDDDGSFVSGCDATTYMAYDEKTDPSGLPDLHYTKFSINRLSSFYDMFETCSQILSELNDSISSGQKDLAKYITEEGGYEYIYDSLMSKYVNAMSCISARMGYLQGIIDDLQEQNRNYQSRINYIKNITNMQSFLENYAINYGLSDMTILWKELCSFKREDTYHNDNYIGEDIDEYTLMQNVEELLKQAEKEIEKACELNYSIETNISNLLVLPEFKPLWDKFDLGNYIRVRIDDDIFKLKLISIEYDYSNLASIGVSFSNVTKIAGSDIDDVSQIISQASSLASNFNFYAKQSQRGSEAQSTLTNILNNGLDVANSRITSATNQSFVIDERGITGREYDEIAGDYTDQQIRIINNLLCFTDDGWKHTKAALGKISVTDPTSGVITEKYGLLAEAIIGELILGEQLIINSQSNGTVLIDENGITIKDTNGNAVMSAQTDGNASFSGQVNATSGSFASTDGTSNVSIANGKLSLYGGNNTNNLSVYSHIGNYIYESGINPTYYHTYRINRDATIDSQVSVGLPYDLDSSHELYNTWGIYLSGASGNIISSYLYYNGNTNASYLAVTNATISNLTVDGGTELYHQTPYIDFHVDNIRSYDFTTRLIQYNNDGVIHLKAITDGTTETYGSLEATIITPSSKKVKDNIESMSYEEADKILQLNPVTFDYKVGYGGKDKVGLIAEEVYEIIPRAIHSTNDIPSIEYNIFIPYLIKEIQKLNAEIEKLKEGSNN